MNKKVNKALALAIIDALLVSTEKKCIECEKMAFHRMAIVTWNAFYIGNKITREEK